MGCIFSSNAAANEKAPPVTSNRTLPSTSSAPRSTAADDSYSQSLVNPIQQNHPALASGTPRDRSTSGALSPRNSAANATSPLPNNNLQQHRSTTRVHRRSLASGTPRGSASNNPRDPSAASVRQRAASSVHRSSAANAPRDRLAANTFRYSVAVSSESSDQIATSRLSSLLSIVTTQLRSSSTTSSDDTETLRLMRPVLNLLDDAFTRGLNSIRDVELLQDFILNALRNGSLKKLDIQDANQKARKLMYLLISVTDVLPKSLFIVNVTNLDGIGVGGSGHVFKGEYKGRPVAMKVVSNVSRDPSSRKAFYREALVWRSLSHRFILPFLGIYKDEFQLYLVSPYMENGTLSHWRKSREPTVAEIHRVMLEVAEGFKYIHSEGVTHGDLHGGNILLDSNFHCQIFDFGLARPAGTTVGRSAHRFLPNFASPELFGMCTNCGRVDCNGCGDDTQKGNVTMKIDVYAFGSLYYATFFDTVPFQGRSTFQIMSLITSGQRAGRLQTPNMEDDTWALIQRCWRSEPSARPEMQEIVKMLAQRP